MKYYGILKTQSGYTIRDFGNNSPIAQGLARVFRGDNPPTEEQCDALFMSEAVPEFITSVQMRDQLDTENLLSSVEAIVAQVGGKVKIWWEYAVDIRRDHPMVAQVAVVLGKNDEWLDEFFINAKKIV